MSIVSLLSPVGIMTGVWSNTKDNDPLAYDQLLFNKEPHSLEYILDYTQARTHRYFLEMSLLRD